MGHTNSHRGAPNPAPRACAVFRTSWGWMGLVAVERGARAGICRLILPRASRRSVERELASDHGSAARGGVPSRHLDQLVAETCAQVVDYLAGRRRSVDVPVVLDGGTPFQRQVWRSITGVPYGRARSYKWVAARVGGARHARAVGMALGANPVPLLVPCHRIVAHDASLGGFTGGLRLKRRLLELEGTLPLLCRRRQ